MVSVWFPFTLNSCRLGGQGDFSNLTLANSSSAVEAQVLA